MKVIHFSGLNGLRAIAALGVMFSHLTADLIHFGLDQHLLGTNSDGSPVTSTLAGFGVSIFFALSGFLITYLLLEEKKTGEINIKNFYMRRILRIWPLYYLYLFLSVLTIVIFNEPINKSSLLFHLFLLPNIPFVFDARLLYLGHYWSLGVEEQFYSFWPWIVKKSKSIFKITLLICIAFILLKVVLRFYDITKNNGEITWPYELLHVTRFHCMLIGALGAILHFNNNALFLKITNNYISQSVCWLIIILVTINKFHIASFLDNEIISIVTVFLIIGQIKKDKRIVNLETSFFHFIGKISFGIYVLHPLLIAYMSKLFNFHGDNSAINYIIVYVLVFSCTILLAYISYNYFEKRFLKAKEKYSSVLSSPEKID